jgi:inhibitor of the pro-sigma K processing machinery
MPQAAAGEVVMENTILIGIIVACLIFIIVCIIRRRPDRIVDFGLRACFGTAGIYLLDLVFRMKGMDINVGVNGVSVLTNGLLGLPGFLLLYGLAFYYSAA